MKDNILVIALSVLSAILLFFTVSMLLSIDKLKEENRLQQEDLEYLNEEIEALQPTQMQRYFYSLIDEVVLGGEVQFVELGKTYDDEIEDWSYKNYVVELEETTMVVITIEFDTTFFPSYDELVDMNIYYGGISEADITYENLEKSVSYTLALQSGFNTIELDSYSSNSWEYSITIEEKE